jgi:hydrogenase maturation factor HypE
VRNETRMPIPLTPIQHNLGIPSQSNKAKEEIKEIQIDKEIVKISLSADNMILYLKDKKKNSIQKLLDIINSFNNVVGYKINLQKSVAFLNTNNEQTEKEYRKNNSIYNSLKKIKYPEINLTKDVMTSKRRTINH